MSRLILGLSGWCWTAPSCRLVDARSPYEEILGQRELLLPAPQYICMGSQQAWQGLLASWPAVSPTKSLIQSSTRFETTMVDLLMCGVHGMCVCMVRHPRLWALHHDSSLLHSRTPAPPGPARPNP